MVDDEQPDSTDPESEGDGQSSPRPEDGHDDESRLMDALAEASVNPEDDVVDRIQGDGSAGVERVDYQDILQTEYLMASSTYDSRDNMVFRQFYVLLALVSGQALVLSFITENLEEPVRPLTITMIGILGWLAILGLSVNLQSAHSAKVAVRERLRNVETDLQALLDDGTTDGMTVGNLWGADGRIPTRRRYFLEKLYKYSEKRDEQLLPRTIALNREEREGESALYNLSVYTVVVVWVVAITGLLGEAARSDLYSVVFLGFVAATILVPAGLNAWAAFID